MGKLSYIKNKITCLLTPHFHQPCHLTFFQLFVNLFQAQNILMILYGILPSCHSNRVILLILVRSIVVVSFHSVEKVNTFIFTSFTHFLYTIVLYSLFISLHFSFPTLLFFYLMHLIQFFLIFMFWKEMHSILWNGGRSIITRELTVLKYFVNFFTLNHKSLSLLF